MTIPLLTACCVPGCAYLGLRMYRGFKRFRIESRVSRAVRQAQMAFVTPES